MSFSLKDSSICCFTVFLLHAAIGDGMFEIEKPVVFTYDEIRSATDEFSDSSLLGHGNYGSVYFGLLREQVCAFSHIFISEF